MPTEVKAGVALWNKETVMTLLCQLWPWLHSFFAYGHRVLRHTHYSVHQVLKHIFQDGWYSEGESTEDETESEHVKFCSVTFHMIEWKVYHLETPENGTSRGASSGASIVAPADIGIFDENMIIDDESGISNEDDGDLWTWQLLAVHSVYVCPHEAARVCVCVCVCVCAGVCTSVCSRGKCWLQLSD